jgi:hypothetical protein
MIRTLGRTLLLSAVAVVALHSSASADEVDSLGRIPEFQKLLNTTISYELPVDATLDKALDDLLKQNKIPYVVNDAAFGPDNRDIVNKTPVEKIDKLNGLTRASVLKKLLAKIPNDGGKTSPTYILRPDHLEITTRDAMMREFYPGRYDSHLPSLAYAVFKQTPLPEALAELARTTESTVVLDPKSVETIKAKVTAELLGVPADTAVQVLADMAGLKLVRLENVYYVTTPENAELLRKEASKRRLELDKAAGDSDPTNLPVIP